ncbi:MAG: hypothetical protein GWN01_01910 [Nitrosopumilaceae archaeon]|nr:hypothetical protein [Nitrosopumilaceae archaeon]NIT99728.1 hypothetical protein [Nitrosopumilaceae archaeon]NIU88589.1 hypothetical protein [Nitrosopumilaceae archaeon]NIV64863.1 hypothetical protein [Nitrosopumilaceae archaeon]NIX60331.1 hypothetical protein [Nitrosopumilaceae archaeon]
MSKKLEELNQILIKEQINEVSCSKLEPDFYKKTTKYKLNCQDNSEIKQIDKILKRILEIRIGKLLTHIDIVDMRKIKDNLTDEECLFFEKISNAQEILMNSTLPEVLLNE